MVEDKIRFFFDENMPVELASQLQDHGIDTLTVRELDRLGEDDLPILSYALEHGYVICTFDSDYIDMAKQGREHKGIVFVPNDHSELGVMTRYLMLLHEVYSANEMINRVEYMFG